MAVVLLAVEVRVVLLVAAAVAVGLLRVVAVSVVAVCCFVAESLSRAPLDGSCVSGARLNSSSTSLCSRSPCATMSSARACSTQVRVH